MSLYSWLLPKKIIRFLLPCEVCGGMEPSEYGHCPECYISNSDYWDPAFLRFRFE